MSNYQTYIDRSNYYNDPRVCDPAEKPVLYIGDTEIELPTKWVVCPVCNGNGTHVNPSIDAGGISGERFADDPEFYDDYMSGAFDVTCNCCGGRTTVPGVDWSQLSDEHRKAYEQQLEDEANDRALMRAERMAGC